jgi:hypothetical protein
MPHTSDIHWTLPPEQSIERADPLAMDELELLAYCCDLQAEALALRHALRASVEQLARMTDDLRRAARIIEALRREQRDRLAA